MGVEAGKEAGVAAGKEAGVEAGVELGVEAGVRGGSRSEPIARGQAARGLGVGFKGREKVRSVFSYYTVPEPIKLFDVSCVTFHSSIT